MKINSLRSAFCVYLVDSEGDKEVLQVLQKAGYDLKSFSYVEEAIPKIPDDPPHILLFRLNDMEINLGQLIPEVRKISPETHIIVLSPKDTLATAIQLCNHGVYDCVEWPLISPLALERALDRACESDYYKYRQEQHSQDLAPQVEETDFLPWLKGMIDKASYKDAIDHFMSEISKFFKQQKVVYLKYIPNYQSLVAAASVGLPEESYRGRGVSLAEVQFHANQLHEPQNIPSICELVEEALGQKKYALLPLHTDEGCMGVFVIYDQQESDLQQAHVQCCLQLLIEVCNRIHVEKQYHTVNFCDELTSVLNRHSFSRKLHEEVSRARRIVAPVSLVLGALDMPEGLNKEASEMDTLLKMVAGILSKHSRINDIIGRVGVQEFGLILPHTTHKGAAIKAERLRRIIESADFSAVVPQQPKVTLSLGVSEYPSLSLDADDIFQTADEALYEVKRAGSNRVCLAVSAEGFQPDFIVETAK